MYLSLWATLLTWIRFLDRTIGARRVEKTGHRSPERAHVRQHVCTRAVNCCLPLCTAPMTREHTPPVAFNRIDLADADFLGGVDLKHVTSGGRVGQCSIDSMYILIAHIANNLEYTWRQRA